MGAAAAGAHAAMANATKASGVVVKVEPTDFSELVPPPRTEIIRAKSISFPEM